MRETIRVPASEGSDLWKRIAVSTAGGTLLALGLRRRSITGYATALAGGWILYRGLRGEQGRRIDLVSLDELEASARALDVQRTLTIQATPEEVRAFLSDPANLDTVLGDTGSVTRLGEDGQRWTLATPLGGALSWEMRRIEEEEEDVLGWASTEDARLDVQIATKPAPGDRETEVTLHVGSRPPGGGPGQAVLDRLDVVPHAIASRALVRVKSLVETGELPTLEPSPSARETPPTPPR